jgi:hypothetical protein
MPEAQGYWTFLDRHRDRFAGNHRTSRAVRQLDRLTDLAEVRRQEYALDDAAMRHMSMGRWSEKFPNRLHAGQRSTHPRTGRRQKRWCAGDRE